MVKTGEVVHSVKDTDKAKWQRDFDTWKKTARTGCGIRESHIIEDKPGSIKVRHTCYDMDIGVANDHIDDFDKRGLRKDAGARNKPAW